MFGNFLCNAFQCVASGTCQCRSNSGSNRNDDVFLTNHSAYDDGDDPVHFLMNEYESLSVEDQIRADNELYGKSQEEIPETDEFITEKLKELDMEINHLSADITRPYFQALKQEREQEQEVAGDNNGPAAHNSNDSDCTPRPSTAKHYVRSPAFHLLFLRADRFNSKFAARRIMRYFTEKLELFGESKLSKKIKVEDFLSNELDRKALYFGPTMVDPGATDSAGRLIVLCDRSMVFKNPENMIHFRRAAFYFSTLIENSIESQKKGVVVINHRGNTTKDNSTRFSFPHFRLYLPLSRLLHHAVPARIAGIHVWYNTVSEHVLLSMVFKMLPKSTRPRCVLHYYMRHKEVVLLMTKYGIAVSTLHLLEEGAYDYDRIKKTLDEIGKKEEEE